MPLHVVTVGARNGSLQWYASRLRAMTLREVGARVSNEVRARAAPARPRRRAANWLDGDWVSFVSGLAAEAPGRFVPDASAIAGGSLRFWGRDVDVDPRAPEWLRHPFTGDRWPRRGSRRWKCDPKPIWELHRQQHLFPLSAGARLSGRGDWADTALAQIDHWILHNPPGSDPGWVSGYEASHRLVTWTLALPLVIEAAAPATRARIDQSFDQQARLIELRPSRYSSANNHRLAELLGLLAASAVQGDERRWASRWRELEREALLQTFADGGSREQAAGYFLYALEILTVACLLALGRGLGIGRIGERLEAMLSWLSATAGVDGEPPPVGDDAEDRMLRDDYFAPRRANALVARARSVVERKPSLASTAPQSAQTPQSVILPESGYAVLRESDAAAPIRVVFDIGDLGYGPLAAHGHADALSVLVDVGATPVLRDSGTASYASAEGRDLFRLTTAHNSVVVDGGSQADPLGPHLWGRRYHVETEAHRLSRDWDYVRASHDGYAPSVHTRSVLRLDGGLVVVLDRVKSPADRKTTLTWNIGAPPRIAVAAAPSAAADCSVVPYSRRYSSLEEAARLTWTARGREVVFATVLSLAADAVPVVLLHHSAERTYLRVTDPQQITLIENWHSDAPQLER